MVKRKALFDDRPVEISVSDLSPELISILVVGHHSKLLPSNSFFIFLSLQELTFVIKQDLSRLNGQILALQQHVRANAAKANRSTRQMDEHSTNLVIILQSKLANTSMGFKEALEIRSEVRKR